MDVGELCGGLEREARELGADFFGVADLEPARPAILEQGGPAVAAFPRAVSVGIALPHAIVDQLPRRSERAVAMSYRHQAYDVVNQRLDHLVSRLAGRLQRAGYRALPVPPSQTVDTRQLRGAFSNKLAGHLAGLGWIGRSCLLVTPQSGPRVRWASVLTAAPLVSTGRPMAPQCGECRECVDRCPAGAFTGRLFREEEPRELRFDVHKCKAYLDQTEQAGGLPVCGMCLYACPRGRDASARLSA
ncbi:MAG: 4Fe-4S double cluster binding domain-containing protein [Candidatus Methylomirabilota bacterium]